LSYLIQILLPVRDNRGRRLPRRLYTRTQRELTEKFKGLTAYSRAPAEGLWKPRGSTKREEIVVYEVMSANLEKQWWKGYRDRLEQEFRQEEVIIRAHEVQVL
jgi:hypothetical protein